MAKSFLGTGVTIIDTSSDLPAASAALEGIMVFQKDTNELKICDGTNWISMLDTDTPQGLVFIPITSGNYSNTGGSVSLSNGTLSFTSITTLHINNIFSSAYDNYRIVIFGSGAGGEYQLRMRAGSTTNSSSNYFYAANYAYSNNSTNNDYSGVGGGATYFSLRNDTTSPQTTIVDLTTPYLNTTPTTYQYNGGYWSSSTVYIKVNYAGSMNVSTSYDGFTLTLPSGSLTGNVRVYGYRNSI